LISARNDSTRLYSPQKATFADEQASALLGERIDELSRPDRAGWEQVKHNASRTVYRKEVAGRLIYLKHYHSRTIVHRIGRLLGFSDAKFEMRFSGFLASRGVQTPQALAAMCANGTEWLAMLAVAPAELAHEWQLRRLSAGPAGRRAVQQAIIALARTVGRMHAIGVIHCDLHAGNILIRTDDKEPMPVLMDLHRMKRRRRLSRRARVANLAQLFHDRAEWTTRTERLRFLKHYLRASSAGGSLRGWQSMVEQFARRHRRRLYAQRDRRTVSDNRYFQRIKLGRGWRGYVILASKRRMGGSSAAELVFEAEDWRRALERPEQLLAGAGVRVIKSTPSVEVVRTTLRLGKREVNVIVKRSRRKRAWKIVLDCFRRAKPIRAFRLGHALLTRRIATALPMAALQRRVGPLLLDSILITEAVDAPQLYQFLNQWLTSGPGGGSPLSAPQRRQLTREVLGQMGKLLQRLHDNSFHHRDLKGQNMLVRWSPGSCPQIVLVDLDGLRRVRRLTQKQMFHGLMRLNVSLLRCPPVNHAGRLRMLLGYLRRPGCGRINFKPYWRVLETWSARKLRQQIRSRRKKQRAARR